MKRNIAKVLSKFVAVPFALVFAVVASTWWVNKPEVPAELRK